MFQWSNGRSGPRTTEVSTLSQGSGRYRKILRLCADDPYMMPNQSGALALKSEIVTEHGQLEGRDQDDHLQYQTVARADAWLEGKTTDDLQEGAGNRYHTEARVRQVLGAATPLAYNSTNGVFSMPQAGPAQAGHLSASDWSAFNSKASATHTHSASDIVAGTLAVARGGTGLGSLASGKLLYSSAADVLAALTLGSTLAITGGVLDVVVNSTNQKLEVAKGGTLSGTRKRLNFIDGTNISMTVSDNAGADRVDVSVEVSGTLPVGLGGTGLSAASTGDLLYGSAADTLSALPGNTSTTRKFLTQTGNGTQSAAPSWQAVQASDLPAHDHSAAQITSGTLGVLHGGTGLGSIASGKLLYASASDTLSPLTLGSNLAIASDTLTARQEVAQDGTSVGTRKTLNLVEGTSISLTVADNPGTDSVDVTIALSGSVSGGTITNGVCDGRLSLATGSPTADVSTSSTLYYTPFVGNRIALYDGSDWAIHEFPEISLALSGLTSGKNYDVFAYWDSGTDSVKLELGAAWSNDTTRATGLTTQDGVQVQSGAATRRWLGLFRTTATNASKDTLTERFLCNAYHKVVKRLESTDGSLQTNSSTTFAQVGSVRLQYVTDGTQGVVLHGSSVLYAANNAISILSIGSAGSTRILTATQAYHAYNAASDSSMGVVHLTDTPAAGYYDRYLIFKSGTSSNNAYADGAAPSPYSAAPSTWFGGTLAC